MTNVIINIPNVTREEQIGSCLGVLFALFNDIEQCASNDISLNFSNTTFLHPFFLAPLALYIKQSNKNINTINKNSYFETYFSLISFSSPQLYSDATSCSTDLSKYDSRTYLPIVCFKLGTQHIDLCNEIQSIIQKKIETQSKIHPSMRSTLSYLLSELICNMNEHSQSSEGYIFSQFLQRDNSIYVCLADEGITIHGSYANHPSYSYISTPAEALKKACSGISTKQLPNGQSRGFGISTSTNILVNGLNGEFLIFSGGGFYRNSLIAGEKFVNLPPDINWKGTLIFLKIPSSIPSGFNLYNYISN